MISPGIFFHFCEILIYWAVRGDREEGGGYAPYLRNSKAYYHEFSYTCVNWWYLQALFLVFWNFCVLGYYGVKGQKIAQNEKVTITLFMYHNSGTVKHMIMIFGTLVLNDDISRQFIHFFESFIFGAVRVIKGQKIAQNDKNFCLSCLISQERYIIWSSFVVHNCKMIITSGVFFIFSKVWFLGLLVGSKGKRWSKMIKNSVFCTLYLSNHTWYDLDLW